MDEVQRKAELGAGSPLWVGPGEGLITPGYHRDREKEVILHTAVYAGLPAANAAFAIAQEALAEDEPN